MDTLDIRKKATRTICRADHIFNCRSDAAGQLRRSAMRRTRRLNRVGATLAVAPSCRITNAAEREKRIMPRTIYIYV